MAKIFWTQAEFNTVATEYQRVYPTALAEKTNNAETRWNFAQQVLPAHRQKPLNSSSSGSPLNKLYAEWLKASRVKPKAVVPTAVVVEPVVDGAPVTAHVDKPPVLPTVQSSVTSTIDNLLKQVVGLMVESELVKYEERQRQMLREHQEALATLLGQQQQQLMAYWNSTANRATPTPPAATEPWAESQLMPVSKTPPKPTKPKVFISGGTNALFHSIVDKMPNVEFYHGDGHNPRSLTLASTYDLVIATKFTSHAASGKLKEFYGSKFKFVKKGGITEVVMAIRHHFAPST